MLKTWSISCKNCSIRAIDEFLLSDVLLAAASLSATPASVSVENLLCVAAVTVDAGVVDEVDGWTLISWGDAASRFSLLLTWEGSDFIASWRVVVAGTTGTLATSVAVAVVVFPMLKPRSSFWYELLTWMMSRFVCCCWGQVEYLQIGAELKWNKTWTVSIYDFGIPKISILI